MQFRYLPYLPLRNELTFGNIIIWDYNNNKEKYINDQEIRNKIDQYLKQHKTFTKNERQLTGIKLISFKKPDNFNHLTRNQINEMSGTLEDV